MKVTFSTTCLFLASFATAISLLARDSDAPSPAATEVVLRDPIAPQPYAVFPGYLPLNGPPLLKFTRDARPFDRNRLISQITIEPGDSTPVPPADTSGTDDPAGLPADTSEPTTRPHPANSGDAPADTPINDAPVGEIYRGNLGLIDPDTILPYFEDDARDLNGESLQFVLPFEQTGPPQLRSNATYTRE